VLGQAVLDDLGRFDIAPIVRIFSFPVPRTIVVNTLLMGLLAATAGTLLGFAFALVTARALRGPLRTAFHYVALLPLIAPPFALALATIFLFGRQGLLTRGLFHWETDPYGLTGLLFVQTITFFPGRVPHLRRARPSARPGARGGRP